MPVRNSTLNEGKVGNFLLRGCVRFLSEKSLNKILNGARSKLMSYKGNPKAEEELQKISNALNSNDKKYKREVISSYLKVASDKDLAAADNKLKAAVNKDKSLKEDVTIITAAAVFGLQAGEALVVGLISGIVLTTIVGIVTNIAVKRAREEYDI